MIDSHHRVVRSLLLFGLAVLLPEVALAQTGQWKLKEKDACSAIIIGPAGGALSGAYRISNDADTTVNLYLNKCTEEACSEKDEEKGKCCPAKDQIAGKCCPPSRDKVANACADAPFIKCPYRVPDAKPPKNALVLLGHNTIDLFVNSCLKIEEIDEGSGRIGTEGTYENLSHVSAPQ